MHKLATAGSYAMHSEMLRTKQTGLGAKPLVLVMSVIALQQPSMVLPSGE